MITWNIERPGYFTPCRLFMSLTWVISFHKVYTVTIYFFFLLDLCSPRNHSWAALEEVLHSSPCPGCGPQQGVSFSACTTWKESPLSSHSENTGHLLRHPVLAAMHFMLASKHWKIGQPELEGGGGAGLTEISNISMSISNGGWAALQDSCLHDEQIITLKPCLTQLYIFHKIKHHICFPTGSQVHFWWDIPPISGTSLSQPSPASP